MPPDKLTHNGWINLLSDPADYHVVLLAAMGMTANLISRETGLTISQVRTRLHKANKGRADRDKLNGYNYRNGISESADAVIQLASKRVSQIVTAELRKQIIDV